MWLWNSKVLLLRARAALGAAFHRKGYMAFPKGKQLAWDGKSKIRSSWKPGGIRRHQNGWAQGGLLTRWQVYTDKAGEMFPSGKCCCKTAGLRGFTCKQNTLHQFPQHMSRTQEKTVKHEVTNSPRPWHRDWVTAFQNSSHAVEKTWEIHTVRQHFWSTYIREFNAAQERRGLCIHSSQRWSQDRIWCCCRQQEDTVTS